VHLSHIADSFEFQFKAVARNGKRQEAEDLFRRCLAGREVQLGFNHIDTLTTVNHLAGSLILVNHTTTTRISRKFLIVYFIVLLKQMGRFKEADVLFQRALIGLSEGLGRRELPLNHLLMSDLISYPLIFDRSSSLIHR
jgi:hypothetical protein